tara:strand:- start:25 stop:606 length:582 start_codon:yes stop_codon:yes gene_type:complete
MNRPCEIAPTIARLLPGNWRFHQIESQRASEHRPGAVIQNDDRTALRIFLNQCWRDDKRLTISGPVPGQHTRYPQERRITVAASRSAEAIAGDINRRFLPGYLKACEAGEKFAEGRNAVERDKELKFSLLKRYLPEMRENRSSRLSHRCRFGQIDLSYDRERVHIDGQLPFDLFIAFLASLPEDDLKQDREGG